MKYLSKAGHKDGSPNRKVSDWETGSFIKFFCNKADISENLFTMLGSNDKFELYFAYDIIKNMKLNESNTR